MKFRRRSRENIELNLISLIDVVFVLLLFFVITTTFTRETQLRVELPEAVNGAPEQTSDLKRIDIAISAEGVYAVNNQLLPKSDLPTLIEALRTASAGDSTLPLSISADGKTPHQAVISAMDAAGKLGFSQISMITVEAQANP